jgi:hypothetical protein
MGYAIELSFDVRKQRSLVTTTEERRKLAIQYGCEMQYFMHEIEGKGRRILRSDGIQVILFSEEDVDSLLEFIRVVRRDRSTYVECVYRDDCTCELLFASPKYLQRMDKNLARTFKRKLKSRTTGTPLEEHILDAMRRH